MTSHWRQIVGRDFGSLAGWGYAMRAELAAMAGVLDRYIQPVEGPTRRLVFVCLGNLNRSAFAEAVAVRMGANSISLGLAAAHGTTPNRTAVQCAARFGIDLSRHVPTDISDYDPLEGDLLLTMEPRHARHLVDRGHSPAAVRLLGYWATPHRLHVQGPHGSDPSYTATCFTLLHSAVHALLGELALQAPGPTEHRPLQGLLKRER